MPLDRAVQSGVKFRSLLKPYRGEHLANNSYSPLALRSSLLSELPLCSDRERVRGDTEVWGPNGENSVGLLQDVGLRVRYTYDQCFDGTRTNQQASRVAVGIAMVVSAVGLRAFDTTA